MAVTVSWAKVSDPQHLLQGARAADQLAEDGPHAQGAERTLDQLGDPGQHFVLPVGVVGFLVRRLLDFADFQGQRGALVHALDDLAVYLIDFGPKSCLRSRAVAGASGLV